MRIHENHHLWSKTRVGKAKLDALAVAIMSYNGRMNFGLIGDFDAMRRRVEAAGGGDHRLPVDRLAQAEGIANGGRRVAPGPDQRDHPVGASQRQDVEGGPDPDRGEAGAGLGVEPWALPLGVLRLEVQPQPAAGTEDGAKVVSGDLTLK